MSGLVALSYNQNQMVQMDVFYLRTTGPIHAICTLIWCNEAAIAVSMSYAGHFHTCLQTPSKIKRCIIVQACTLQALQLKSEIDILPFPEVNPLDMGTG